MQLTASRMSPKSITLIIFRFLSMEPRKTPLIEGINELSSSGTTYPFHQSLHQKLTKGELNDSIITSLRFAPSGTLNWGSLSSLGFETNPFRRCLYILQRKTDPFFVHALRADRQDGSLPSVYAE